MLRAIAVSEQNDCLIALKWSCRGPWCSRLPQRASSEKEVSSIVELMKGCLTCFHVMLLELLRMTSLLWTVVLLLLLPSSQFWHQRLCSMLKKGIHVLHQNLGPVCWFWPLYVCLRIFVVGICFTQVIADVAEGELDTRKTTDIGGTSPELASFEAWSDGK